MPNILDRRVSFSGGEMSPFIDPRVDLEKYRTGCRQLVNFRPKIYGGAFRRSGTIYLGNAASDSHPARLVPFEFSLTNSLNLEFSHQTLRFWTTGTNASLILDPNVAGTPLQLTTPWQASEIYQLHYAQQNDIIVITHPNHPPHILSRLANNQWDLDPLEAEWPAVRDLNTTQTALSLSHTSGSNRVLSSSTPIFDPNHVGSRWILRHRRNSSTVSHPLSAAVNTSSPSLFVLGAWTCSVAVNTGGTWEKTAAVQRSYDGTTWETIRTISSSGISSGIISGNELDPTFLRVLILTGSGTPPTSGSFQISATDPDHYCLLTVTGYEDPETVIVTIDFPAAATTETKLWHEGSWSAYRGYPRALTFHSGRLFFAGTLSQPQTIWGSIVDDFFNFRIGADADLALDLTLAADDANSIVWLVSQEALIAGTSGGEWTIGTRSAEQALTPETAAAKRNSKYGSAPIQARSVHDSTLFAQRGGRKIREFSYSYDRDGYVANDLTLLAEHISAPALIQMAVSNNPETVIYCVRSDGQLACLTYERTQNVSGWCRFVTDGHIESVAVIASNIGEDEVWLSVKRRINGTDRRYIERLQTGHAAALEAGEPSLLAYSDSAKSYVFSTPTSSITGLSHLEGRQVTILADGSQQASKTVSSGAITLDVPASTVIVGLPYTSTLEPTYLETPDPSTSTRAIKKRLHRVTVDLYRSLEMQISGDAGTTWINAVFRSASDPMDTPPPLFTGVHEEFIQSSSKRLCSPIIQQSSPLPLNITALYLQYDVSEP